MNVVQSIRTICAPESPLVVALPIYDGLALLVSHLLSVLYGPIALGSGASA